MNIDHMFKRHMPDAKQQESMNKLRELAKILAQDIKRLCPGGRNRTVAVEHVEDALMRANKAIVEDANLPVMDQELLKRASAAVVNAGEVKWKDSLRDNAGPAMFGGSVAVADKVMEELKAKIHDNWMKRVRAAGATSRKLYSKLSPSGGEEMLVPYTKLSDFAKHTLATDIWWVEL
jgi:hypothetical protein